MEEFLGGAHGDDQRRPLDDKGENVQMTVDEDKPDIPGLEAEVVHTRTTSTQSSARSLSSEPSDCLRVEYQKLEEDQQKLDIQVAALKKKADKEEETRRQAAEAAEKAKLEQQAEPAAGPDTMDFDELASELGSEEVKMALQANLPEGTDIGFVTKQLLEGIRAQRAADRARTQLHSAR